MGFRGSTDFFSLEILKLSRTKYRPKKRTRHVEQPRVSDRGRI